MGKTSLLNNLGRLLPSSIVPMFVDLQGPAAAAADHAGLLYNLARGMIDSARRQRQLTLPALSRESLTQDPFTRFDEWLDEVVSALGTSTALLAFDELEALDRAMSEGRFSEAAVLGMLRHMIQHRPRLKVLLATSYSLDELSRWSSYLINVQVVHVSYLQEEESLQLIERPTGSTRLRYAADASQRVYQLTKGHPFLLQLLCAEIISYKNEQSPEPRRLATIEDVEAAIPLALAHGSFFFSDIERNQIGPDAAAMLHYLATHSTAGVSVQELLSNNWGDEVADMLAQLRRRDLIEETASGYTIQVELIRRWFSRPGAEPPRRSNRAGHP
jgi:hypothetical protein